MRVRALQRSFDRCCLTEELGLRLLECSNATHSADDYNCERLVEKKSSSLFSVMGVVLFRSRQKKCHEKNVMTGIFSSFPRRLSFLSFSIFANFVDQFIQTGVPDLLFFMLQNVYLVLACSIYGLYIERASKPSINIRVSQKKVIFQNFGRSLPNPACYPGNCFPCKSKPLGQI